MRLLRSTWGKRGIVAGMLLSMLPLVAAPLVHERPGASIDRYADWLRGQFDDDAAEIVEMALDTARRQSADDFSSFLTAFVAAYRIYTGAGAVGVSHQALLEAFPFGYLRLTGTALAPQWILKSAVRSTLSSERVHFFLTIAARASSGAGCFERSMPPEPLIDLLRPQITPLCPRAP